MRLLTTILASLILITGMAYAQGVEMNNTHLEKATFAGGCFWCMQPFFDHTKGVVSTVVGYTGGHTENPTYDEVSTGETGHAESIEITYDPKVVSYGVLLELFWHNIDPTAVNSQFADEGTQYRSAIFYHNEEQKSVAEASKAALAASGRFDKPIATEIVPATVFYPAEEYHQKYYQKSTMNYNMYHDHSGREEFIQEHWGKSGQ
jgi:methionine-S-sulfoxide reductase